MENSGRFNPLDGKWKIEKGSSVGWSGKKGKVHPVSWSVKYKKINSAGWFRICWLDKREKLFSIVLISIFEENNKMWAGKTGWKFMEIQKTIKYIFIYQ